MVTIMHCRFVFWRQKSNLHAARFTMIEHVLLLRCDVIVISVCAKRPAKMMLNEKGHPVKEGYPKTIIVEGRCPLAACSRHTPT